MPFGTAGRTRTWIAVAGAALTGVVLAACGGSSGLTSKSATTADLNTARVALAIEQSILSERHIHAAVVCPPKIAQKKGLTFTCVATTYTAKGHHAVHTSFTVSQTDSAGHVFYQSPK
jgi:hypothetical protein